MVQCAKLKQELEGLKLPPYPGELGQKIYQSISQEAWNEWVGMQTMIINENRLNLADARARKYLREQMEQHLFGAGVMAPEGYVPPSS